MLLHLMKLYICSRLKYIHASHGFIRVHVSAADWGVQMRECLNLALTVSCDLVLRFSFCWSFYIQKIPNFFSQVVQMDHGNLL
jgi:hypothetical protein